MLQNQILISCSGNLEIHHDRHVGKSSGSTAIHRVPIQSFIVSRLNTDQNLGMLLIRMEKFGVHIAEILPTGPPRMPVPTMFSNARTLACESVNDLVLKLQESSPTTTPATGAGHAARKVNLSEGRSNTRLHILNPLNNVPKDMGMNIDRPRSVTQ